MSFSYDTKNELCRLPVQKLCCARAEGYGVLLYCNTFMPGEVRIITESGDFAARLPKLFHKAFGDGLIVSVKPMGGDALLEIAFDQKGTKRLMAKSAVQFMHKI